MARPNANATIASCRWIELKNRGQEQASLKRLIVKTFNLGTGLFGDKPIGIRVLDTRLNTASREIQLPFVIPGDYWNPNLQCDIQVDLRETDPLQFSSRLEELRGFRVELEYEYEGLSSPPRSGLVVLTGSFEEFCNSVIEHWKQTNDHELVYRAKRI